MAIPDGWVLVPIEPTDAMIEAGRWPLLLASISADESHSELETDVWSAMLAAAPNPSPISEPS